VPYSRRKQAYQRHTRRASQQTRQPRRQKACCSLLEVLVQLSVHASSRLDALSTDIVPSSAALCASLCIQRCRFSFRRSPFSAFSAFSAFGAFSWRRSLEGFASACAGVAAGVGLPGSLLRTDLASSPAGADGCCSASGHGSSMSVRATSIGVSTQQFVQVHTRVHGRVQATSPSGPACSHRIGTCSRLNTEEITRVTHRGLGGGGSFCPWAASPTAPWTCRGCASSPLQAAQQPAEQQGLAQRSDPLDRGQRPASSRGSTQRPDPLDGRRWLPQRFVKCQLHRLPH
jgi:hypothetical protein